MPSAIIRLPSEIVRKIRKSASTSILLRGKDEDVISEQSQTQFQEKEASLELSDSGPATPDGPSTTQHESHDIYKCLQECQQPATQTTSNTLTSALHPQPNAAEPTPTNEPDTEETEAIDLEKEAKEKEAKEKEDKEKQEMEKVMKEREIIAERTNRLLKAAFPPPDPILIYMFRTERDMGSDDFSLAPLAKMDAPRLRYIMRILRSQLKEEMEKNEEFDHPAEEGKRRGRRGKWSWMRIPCDTGVEMRGLTDEAIQQMGGAELCRRIREGHELLLEVTTLTAQAQDEEEDSYLVACH